MRPHPSRLLPLGACSVWVRRDGCLPMMRVSQCRLHASGQRFALLQPLCLKAPYLSLRALTRRQRAFSVSARDSGTTLALARSFPQSLPSPLPHGTTHCARPIAIILTHAFAYVWHRPQRLVSIMAQQSSL